MQKDFCERVYTLVKKIPKGKVLTYGAVAHLLRSKAYRAVGRALHNNPHENSVPCHRVVFADGSLSEAFAFGGSREQYERLLQEGVTFTNKKVNLTKHVWQPLQEMRS